MAKPVFIESHFAGDGVGVVGRVDDQPVEVYIPRDRLCDADGNALDQPGCLKVIEGALRREAQGKAHPWDEESAEAPEGAAPEAEAMTSTTAGADEAATLTASEEPPEG